MRSRLLDLVVFLVLFVSGAAYAQSGLVPKPPDVGATAFLLQDFSTGFVIAEQAADESLEPASLTKMMTAYVVFAELAEGNIGLQDEVLISEKAWKTGGSKMFVEVDKRVSVELLLNGSPRNR